MVVGVVLDATTVALAAANEKFGTYATHKKKNGKPFIFIKLKEKIWQQEFIPRMKIEKENLQ